MTKTSKTAKPWQGGLARLRGMRLAVAAAACAGALAMTGCTEDEPKDPGTTPPADCVSDEAFFEDQVWRPVLSTTCFGCHNAQGIASGSELVFQSQNQPGYLAHNMKEFANIASLERDGVSLVLLKPTGAIEHGGGTLIQDGDEKHKAISAMVERVKTPVDCGDQPNTDGDFFDGVDMHSPEATLRKAALLLNGRLPTDAELTEVREGGDAAVETVLGRMMSEDAFIDRMKELFNDRFLTDKYLGGDDATNLLNSADYPERRWYRDLDDEVMPEEQRTAAQRYTNNSVARAPLELVAHVIKNELPFGEVLTADYMMVNGMSARVYGIDDVNFDNAFDPNEWRPGRIAGIPHAGILTDPMFLNRFPTSATNRNRHRSRMVFDFFLATDVMRLAERPVDPTAITDFNPTLYNPQCTVCHANIDPIAGAFQNWTSAGRYQSPENGWHQDMVPPGFGESIMPGTSYGSSLQWLAQQIVSDPLFNLAIVHSLYRGLTGNDVLLPPSEYSDAPGSQAKLKAYEAEQAELARIAKVFGDENQNVKEAIIALVKSPLFKAKGISAKAESREAELGELGVARFLTPELLHRKIKAVLGFEWENEGNGRDYLLSSNEFLIFYGGMNSDTVTQRITSPNGLMSSIALRMANEMSCRVVPREFASAAEARRLLPLVETSFVPEDENGFEIPAAVAAIKENIRHLHRRVLGEELAIDDPEIERTYQLFYDTWKEGYTLRVADGITRDLNYRCRGTRDVNGEEVEDSARVSRDENYAIRAWMAVVTYMLTDYRFLHE